MMDDEDLGESNSESGGGLNLALGYNFGSSWGVVLSLRGRASRVWTANTFWVRAILQGDTRLHRKANSDPTSNWDSQDSLPFRRMMKLSFTGDGGTGALGFNFFFSKAVALSRVARRPRDAD